MNQGCPEFVGCQSQISHPYRIGGIGMLGLSLTVLHMMHGGSVHNNFRAAFPQASPHGSRVG